MCRLELQDMLLNSFSNDDMGNTFIDLAESGPTTQIDDFSQLLKFSTVEPTQEYLQERKGFIRYFPCYSKINIIISHKCRLWVRYQEEKEQIEERWLLLLI